jgi:signal transduction histidine kinase
MPAKILIKASGIIFLVSFLGVTVVDYKLWTVILLAFGVTSLDFGKRKFTRWALLGLIFLGLWGSRVTPEWVQYLSNWDLIVLTFVVFLYFTQDLVEKLETFFSKRKIRSI